jgi:hypothetical protein
VTTPLVEALDRLAADGRFSFRQHRKLLRAAAFLEQPPPPARGFRARLKEAFDRPAPLDLLGLRYLRGDLGEAAYFGRLKVESSEVGLWGLGCGLIGSMLDGALRHAFSDPARALVEAAFVLAACVVISVGFYFLMALPIGLWWRRRKDRLEELAIQRGAAGDV